MPRPCSVCTHAERKAIDKALLNGSALRTIADQHSVSKTALLRHREAGHLAAAVVRRQEGKELLESKSLTEKIQTLENRVNVLYDDALSLLQTAKADKDSKIALQAIGQARSCCSEARELVRLLGELAGSLPTPGVSLTVLAPLILQTFAEGGVSTAARVAVARKLVELDKTLNLPPQS